MEPSSLDTVGGPGTPAPALGCIRVEIWARGSDRASIPDLNTFLSPDERRRANRFHDVDTRARYVASHAMLRAAVCVRSGQDPASIAIDRRCMRCGHHSHGRPTVVPVAPQSPSRSPSGQRGGLEVSIARTPGLIAVAVSSTAVGLDVERLGSPVSLAGMDRVFSSAELTDLERTAGFDETEGTRAFLEAWVAKEAVGKARGSGLVDLVNLPIGPVSHSAWRQVADGTLTWQVRLLSLGPDHVGAVATPAGPVEVAVVDAWPGGADADASSV